MVFEVCVSDPIVSSMESELDGVFVLFAGSVSWFMGII